MDGVGGSLGLSALAVTAAVSAVQRLLADWLCAAGDAVVSLDGMCLHALPASLLRGGAPALAVLHARSCGLDAAAVCAAASTPFSRLRAVDLEGNDLGGEPLEAAGAPPPALLPACLTELSLSRCRLGGSLPRWLLRAPLPALRWLAAAGAGLTALPSPLPRWPALRALDLRANALLALPPALGADCAALDTLLLSDNPALAALPAGCRVESNLPNALYPRVEATWSPRRTGLESNERVDDLERLEPTLATRPTCLVWIDEEPRYGHLWPLARLKAELDLQQLAKSGDVTVYRMLPRD
jgi:hypothetical protein